MYYYNKTTQQLVQLIIDLEKENNDLKRKLSVKNDNESKDSHPTTTVPPTVPPTMQTTVPTKLEEEYENVQLESNPLNTNDEHQQNIDDIEKKNAEKYDDLLRAHLVIVNQAQEMEKKKEEYIAWFEKYTQREQHYKQNEEKIIKSYNDLRENHARQVEHTENEFSKILNESQQYIADLERRNNLLEVEMRRYKEEYEQMFSIGKNLYDKASKEGHFADNTIQLHFFQPSIEQKYQHFFNHQILLNNSGTILKKFNDNGKIPSECKLFIGVIQRSNRRLEGAYDKQLIQAFTQNGIQVLIIILRYGENIDPIQCNYFFENKKISVLEFDVDVDDRDENYESRYKLILNSKTENNCKKLSNILHRYQPSNTGWWGTAKRIFLGK